MTTYTIIAAAQGLYNVHIGNSAVAVAKINNSGDGRWWLYRVDDGQRVGSRTDVTHIIHDDARLQPAIAQMFAGAA